MDNTVQKKMIFSDNLWKVMWLPVVAGGNHRGME